VPVIIPRSYVQDIDTPEDWEVAEHMWRVLLAREAQDFGPVPA
jgi:hypothetical protein